MSHGLEKNFCRPLALSHHCAPFQLEKRARKRKLLLSEENRKCLGQQRKEMTEAAAGCGEQAGSQGEKSREA